MNAYEVAIWLYNEKGDDATDEEYAEVFALFERMISGKTIPLKYKRNEFIKEMDINNVCNFLKETLTEIQNNATDETKI